MAKDTNTKPTESTSNEANQFFIPVKYFKLVNGEELVSAYIDRGGPSIMLMNTLAVYRDRVNGGPCVMPEWIPYDYLDGPQFEIDRSQILVSQIPSQEIVDYYNETLKTYAMMRMEGKIRESLGDNYNFDHNEDDEGGTPPQMLDIENLPASMTSKKHAKKAPVKKPVKKAPVKKIPLKKKANMVSSNTISGVSTYNMEDLSNEELIEAVKLAQSQANLIRLKGKKLQ